MPSIPSRLMGTGTPAQQALSICGRVGNNLTAAGTTNANALALSNEINVVTTTAASTGVLLPRIETGASVFVSNLGAADLLVYPGTGVQINALTATTGGFTVPTGKSAMFFGASGTRWTTLLSA